MKGGYAISHKKQMKKVVRLFYISFFVFMVGIICWTATALESYWMLACCTTVTGLIGTVVTDSILRSWDADIAELLKEEEEDEAA